jgi:hypothetical protein
VPGSPATTRLRSALTAGFLPPVLATVANFYHIEMATTLGELAIAENSQKYFNRACAHYRQALFISDAVGQHRRTAVAENNHGYLLLAFNKLKDAGRALFRTRNFKHFSDFCPQLDETLARFHIEVGEFDLAEQAIMRSVTTLEIGGEEAVLAESLRTQGRILCRLGPSSRGKTCSRSSVSGSGAVR